MITTAPTLIEGRDFRRLSVREGRGKYRFQLLRDALYTFDRTLIPEGSARTYYDASGKAWLAVEPRRAIIPAPYAWNGNSPKKGVRLPGVDVWLGTPDFDPGTIAASLLHDAIYQFSGLRGSAFTRDRADNFYLQICRQFRFLLAGVYKAALDEFADAAWGKSPPGSHVITTYQTS